MQLTEQYSFTAFFAPLFTFLDNFTRSSWWRAKTVVICFLCVLMFQFPEYQYIYHYAVSHTESNSIYENLVKQIINPWVNHSTNPLLHESKMVFRLTIPLLAHVLHLNIFGILLVQLVMGLAMLWALLTLVERITQDRTIAFLLIVGVCFTYYGGAFLHDVYCFFDAFSYALLALMLLSRKTYIVYLLTIIGGFVDERFLVASLLGVLWHAMCTPGGAVPQTQRLAITPASGAIVAGWVTYFGIRLWLKYTYHFKTYVGDVGLDAVRTNLYNERTALGFVTGLESYWFIIALALLVLIGRQQWKLVIGMVLAFGPVLASSFSVFDITRSLSYGFPIVLISLVVLNNFFTRDSLRNIALAVAAFAIFLPNYYYQQLTFYSESIFEKAAKYMLLKAV